MSFIDILRKLGILRFGTKTGTYTSAKDMPAEFLMDGVYNADKELVTKQDIKNAVAAVTGHTSGHALACSKCGAALKPGARFCGSCGAPCGQPSVNKCSACGAEIKPGAKFCAGCGAPVKDAISAGKPARKKGCLPLVLVALGVLGIIIILAIIGSSGDGKKRDINGLVNTDIPVSPKPGAELPDLKLPGKDVSAGVGSGTANNNSGMDKQDYPAGSPLKDWNPKSGEEAAAGPAGLKYDKYVNKKFGFVAELPAHWESEVKDNAHIFCGAKGTEEYDTTVNFQIINKKPGSTVRSEADKILSQWKTMDEFELDKTDQGDLSGKKAFYMVARFEMPSGQAFQQMQAIIDREPYYYMISYTAPKKLFKKYYFVMVHLIGTFRFTATEKSTE
ncbi:MAG: zinc-ribbon domain-containing protein [Kiritimatiellaeota bacterium]|nr:zinc-ribbon domain-containing protein [Kiritimatiellota bacterium]